jgi:hypothetical protein
VRSCSTTQIPSEPLRFWWCRMNILFHDEPPPPPKRRESHKEETVGWSVRRGSVLKSILQRSHSSRKSHRTGGSSHDCFPRGKRNENHVTQSASVKGRWPGCAKELPREHIRSPLLVLLEPADILHLSRRLTVKSKEFCPHSVFTDLVVFAVFNKFIFAVEILFPS